MDQEKVEPAYSSRGQKNFRRVFENFAREMEKRPQGNVDMEQYFIDHPELKVAYSQLMSMLAQEGHESELKNLHEWAVNQEAYERAQRRRFPIGAARRVAAGPAANLRLLRKQLAQGRRKK